MALVVVGAVGGATRVAQPADEAAAGVLAMAAPGGQAELGPASTISGGSSPAGGSSGADPTPTPTASGLVDVQDTDWWSVMAELDDRRASALEAGDPANLADYARPDSPAWQADEAIVADLAARGLRPEGLRVQLMAIERVEPSGTAVRLQVVDSRSGYELVDADGEVVSTVEPATAARWAVVLARVGSAGPSVPTEESATGPAGGSDPESGPGPDGEMEPEEDPEADGEVAGEADPGPADEADPGPAGEAGSESDPGLGPDPGWRVFSVDLLGRGGATQ